MKLNNNLYYTELLDEIEYVYLSDNRPWIIGFSGGKDSTVVIDLVYEMLRRLPPEKRKKTVHVVSSDTLVENPLIKEYLTEVIDSIRLAAEDEKLPIVCEIVKPKPTHSFWANVIGRGFPTPRLNGSFRWCTDRLKIIPSGEYIKNVIMTSGEEVVVLLGVRKGESQARKKRIEGRKILDRLLNRHESIKDAYVYPPIVDLTTDDVWDILASNNNTTSWGYSTNKLIELYSDASSNECPFAWTVKKDEQTQSCGQSRFGCWMCTVVREDKSLNGFIRSGHRELIPLSNFRKWIISIWDNPDMREKKRRDGKIYYSKTGDLGLGPFDWAARQEILKNLLELQAEINYELISVDELRAIDIIWDDELDLTRRVLVDLYRQTTGKKLPWDHLKHPLYDTETLRLLRTVSEEQGVPYDLLVKMVLVAEKSKHFSNKHKMNSLFENTISQQWLHEDVIKEWKDFDNQTS